MKHNLTLRERYGIIILIVTVILLILAGYIYVHLKEPETPAKIPSIVTPEVEQVESPEKSSSRSEQKADSKKSDDSAKKGKGRKDTLSPTSAKRGKTPSAAPRQHLDNEI